MSISIFRVNCTACSFEGLARVGPSDSHYQLPDGMEATVSQAPAWCTSCAAVVDAEIIPDLNSLEQELRELEHGGPRRDTLLKDAAGFTDPDLILKFTVDSLRATLKWRRIRTSPPHCLTCGSLQVTHVPWNGATTPMQMPHPSCEGNLEFTLYARGVPAGKVYSTEGERLFLEEPQNP